MSAIPVLVDCDTGIDDALALAYLAATPAVEVVGVTTVSGNVDAAQAARNTLDLLDVLGLDVPVAIGAHDPLVGRYGGGVPEVHGRNGVGDVELPRCGREPDARTAMTLFRDLARQHHGALEVLALGPMTNVASMVDDDAAGSIRRIVAMGGAIHAPGNVTDLAEANFFHDPEAADVLLGAEVPVTLVPLDVTMQQRFTRGHLARLTLSTQAHGPLLAAMLAPYLDFYLQRGHRGCGLHDPLAAAILAGDIAVETGEFPLEVGIDDHRRGTVVGARRLRRSTTFVTAVRTDAAELIAERLGA